MTILSSFVNLFWKSIGELFRHITGNTLKYTTYRIWKVIVINKELGELNQK
jgi:hypothetical protein